MVDGLVERYIKPYLLTDLFHFIVKPVIFWSRYVAIDGLEDWLASLLIVEMDLLAVVNYFIKALI